MGLSFFVAEIQAQANEAVALADQYIEYADKLEETIDTYLQAPLSSQTYESARNYFQAVYPPITNALILAAESIREAHQLFLQKFEEIVGGGDIEEDRLRAQIYQGQQLLQSYDEVLNQLEKPNQALEQAYLRTQEAISKLEERLEDLYLFDHLSSTIFLEAESNLDNLERALTAVSKEKTWNAITGTFDMSQLDFTWVRPIAEAWEQRREKQQSSEPKKNLYAVKTVPNGAKQTSDMVYQNGLFHQQLTSEWQELSKRFGLSQKHLAAVGNSSKKQQQVEPFSFKEAGNFRTIDHIVALDADLAIGQSVNNTKKAAWLIRTDRSGIKQVLVPLSGEMVELLTDRS